MVFGIHKLHLKVDEHKLYSEDANKEVFVLYRHSAGDLRRILIQNSKLRDNALARRQQKALAAFKKSELFDFRKDTGHSRKEVIEAYFHLFDDLFFFGSLRRRVELRITYRKFRGPLCTLGITSDREIEDRIRGMFKGENVKKAVEIKIYLEEEEHRSRKEALVEYRATLLHEMIHAFLLCWACDYEECTAAWDGHGHGAIWQDIACALEHATRERGFLHLELRLGREISLAIEVHQTGIWPRKSDFARWNIAERDFLKRYKYVENIEGPPQRRKS